MAQNINMAMVVIIDAFLHYSFLSTILQKSTKYIPAILHVTSTVEYSAAQPVVRITPDTYPN